MVDQNVGVCHPRCVLSRADIVRYYRDKRTHECRPRRISGPDSEFDYQINPLREYREEVQKAVRFYSNMGVFGRDTMFKWYADLAFGRRFRDEKERPQARRTIAAIRRMRLDNPPHMLKTFWPVRYDPATLMVGSNDEDVQRGEQHGVVFERFRFDGRVRGLFARIQRMLFAIKPAGLWTIMWDDDDLDLTPFSVLLSNSRDVAELVHFRLMNGEWFGDCNAE